MLNLSLYCICIYRAYIFSFLKKLKCLKHNLLITAHLYEVSSLRGFDRHADRNT